MINSFTMDSCYFYEPKIDRNGFRAAVKDVRNFARHITIYSPVDGMIPLEPYDFQKGLLKRYQNNDFNVVKHTRQCGVTTMNEIYALWYALFHSGVKVVISSSNFRFSVTSLINIKSMYENLKLMKPSITTYNKNRIVFETGSEIVAVPFSIDSFHGLKESLLICDNAGYVEEKLMVDFYKNFASSFNKIILSSSGCGNKNQVFEDIFCEAIEGISKFKAFNIKGHKPPNRPEEWKKKMVNMLGARKFREEYNY